MAWAGNDRHAPRTVLLAVNLRNVSVAFALKLEGCTVRLGTDNSSAEDPPSSHQDSNKEWHSTSISNMYFSQGEKREQAAAPTLRFMKAQVSQILRQRATLEQLQDMKDLTKN